MRRCVINMPISVNITTAISRCDSPTMVDEAFLSLPLRRTLVLSLLVLAAVRLFTLGAYPVFDQTEARYAEIARLMVETGDWIVPHIDYSVPFWAKPPLYAWLSAASIALLGANEFAVRLPELILGAAIVGLTAIARRSGRDLALTTAIILSSSALFFVAAGAVMTDMALAFCTTLAMVAFHRALEGRERWWGYVFFIALGLGMLAKGPIAVVLTGLPIGAWVLWLRRWHDLWTRLPWFGGVLLAAAISLPWYVAAELRSPGFLSYFLITEHFKRFFASGKIGDLYGHENIQLYGMIWLYWIGATFPWSAILLVAVVRRFRQARPVVNAIYSDPDLRYFLCWALAPVIFFTFIHDILWTYVLPGLPAFSILSAEIFRYVLRNMPPSARWPARITGAAFIAPVAIVGFAVAVAFGALASPTGKELHAQFVSSRQHSSDTLVYVNARPYSAQFYGQGRAARVPMADVVHLVETGRAQFLAVPRGMRVRLPAELVERLELVGGDTAFQLFRVASPQK
jgi:4-amino-4-deoxy-L-arabinose transferase-like glycosyltransferase